VLLYDLTSTYFVGPAKSASPTRVMPDCVAAPRLTISSR